MCRNCYTIFETIIILYLFIHILLFCIIFYWLCGNVRTKMKNKTNDIRKKFNLVYAVYLFKWAKIPPNQQPELCRKKKSPSVHIHFIWIIILLYCGIRCRLLLLLHINLLSCCRDLSIEESSKGTPSNLESRAPAKTRD